MKSNSTTPVKSKLINGDISTYEYSFSEISKILEIPTAEVKRIYQSAIGKLSVVMNNQSQLAY